MCAFKLWLNKRSVQWFCFWHAMLKMHQHHQLWIQFNWFRWFLSRSYCNMAKSDDLSRLLFLPQQHVFFFSSSLCHAVVALCDEIMHRISYLITYTCTHWQNSRFFFRLRKRFICLFIFCFLISTQIFHVLCCGVSDFVWTGKFHSKLIAMFYTFFFIGYGFENTLEFSLDTWTSFLNCNFLFQPLAPILT